MLHASFVLQTHKCPDCGGFGRAVITTGRDAKGRRTTTPVNCPRCSGSGRR